MKEKRNCGGNTNYPIYQQPMMVPPMGYPIGFPTYSTGYQGEVTSNTFEQQLNNIQQQINQLEQRVNRLENMKNSSTTNNYNKYNDSNYYMV